MPKYDDGVPIDEAADELDTSRGEVWRLAQDGELDAYREDATGPLLISLRSIREYLDARDDEDEDADEAIEDAYDRGWEDAQAEIADDE